MNNYACAEFAETGAFILIFYFLTFWAALAVDL